MKVPEWILEKITTVKRESGTELDLSRYSNRKHFEHFKVPEIPTFPDEIFDLSSLEYLNLSGLGINSLPAKICSLSNLKVLALTSNQLTVTLSPETVPLQT